MEPEDVARILQTPLPPRGVPDRFVWHYARTGRYSVKTGYQLASRLCHDQTLEFPGEWNRIWRIKLPPKVKDCLWRICINVLPTKVNLFIKHVVQDKACVFCGYCEETLWLLFVTCPYVIECWEKTRLRAKLEHEI